MTHQITQTRQGQNSKKKPKNPTKRENVQKTTQTNNETTPKWKLLVGGFS